MNEEQSTVVDGPQQDVFRRGKLTRVVLRIVSSVLFLVAVVFATGLIYDGYRAYTRQMASWDVAWAMWTGFAPIGAVIVIAIGTVAALLLRMSFAKVA